MKQFDQTVIRMIRRKARTARRHQKPRNRKLLTKQRQFLTRKSPKFYDEWENFVDRVKGELQMSANAPVQKSPAPYDHPSAVIKRLTYNFVRYHRSKTAGGYIEYSIQYYRNEVERKKKAQRSLRELRISYEINPFYLVLLGLEAADFDVGGFKLGKSDITRFSQQLLYADRHDVPSEFLIGFLFQSGTIKDVCEKAKRVNDRETWFLNRLNGISH